ncbi:MAG: hypothetical protein FWG19_03405 [Methanomassiliicoccaceae archaeon]|nr:hypothetical protein [Methanomassiliicoccaceae archaeon]
MRTRIVDKEELADRLLKKYGHNEPIFTSEIFEAWKEYSRPRAFQLLKELVEEGIIKKEDAGTYYFSRTTLTGEQSVLGRKSIIDKKFIEHGEEVFGYYSGFTLLNDLHLTTQMPYQIELVSSKASAPVRKVEINNFPITVRRSRVTINKKNVGALMLLETFNELDRPLKNNELWGIKEFVKQENVKMEDVILYSRHFPEKAVKNLLGTGLTNVFA